MFDLQRLQISDRNQGIDFINIFNVFFSIYIAVSKSVPCFNINTKDTENLKISASWFQFLSEPGGTLNIRTKLASCLTVDAGNPKILFVPDSETPKPESEILLQATFPKKKPKQP